MPSLPTLLRGLLLDALPAPERRALVVLAIVPYLTPAAASAVGVGRAELDALTGQTLFVVADGERWQLHDVARGPVASAQPAAEAAALRRQVAMALEAQDPATAVALLLDAGAPEDAAELLAARASELAGPQVLRWVYRLPASLRHRLPPALAAARATVDLDAAADDAQRRVVTAVDADARGEALLALGFGAAPPGPARGGGPGARRRVPQWFGWPTAPRAGRYLAHACTAVARGSGGCTRGRGGGGGRSARALGPGAV